jgi:ATP-dependent RNA helicase RhlE
LTVQTFADLGLSAPILAALDARGHTTPTPIQAQAIPALLDGRDILGIAQTGTGKTGAFALPVLHALAAAGSRRGRTPPRALVLAPTRELAIQIGEEIGAYGRGLGLRHEVIFGGVGHGPQIRALKGGLDIVVATPGRLLEHIRDGHASLERVEHLVLDEADRMLDMGFVRDVRKIVAACPARRQSLLFSATMPGAIAELAGEILHRPVRVEIAPQATPVERISQSVHHLEAGEKAARLAEILSDPSVTRGIVFTRTKHRANRVAEALGKAGIEADAIHGNKSQGARQRALARFRSGEARVLVATDIAARGIDVEAVSHVVNFELPNEPESYVHRIGRTARAGADGVAISFCAPDERTYLRDIERLTGIRMEVIGDAPAGPVRPAPKARGGRGQQPTRGGREAAAGPAKAPARRPRRRRRSAPAA